MKKETLTLALLASFSAASVAATIVVPNGSTVIASWSFEAVTASGTAATTPTFTAGTSTADIGSQTTGSSVSALHASTSTVYSTPSGNGTSKALSSNNWAVGDYYQFAVSTSGFSNINLTFGQFGSSTGPRDFKLSYSTDGTTFTDFGTYTVLGTPSWSAATFHSEEVLSFDLSGISALNNAAVTFRLVDNSTTPISGTGSVASAGSDRVDDFTVSSGPVTLAATAAPEPSTFATLLGGVGMLVGFRRLRGVRGSSRRSSSLAPILPGAMR